MFNTKITDFSTYTNEPRFADSNYNFWRSWYIADPNSAASILAIRYSLHFLGGTVAPSGYIRKRRYFSRQLCGIKSCTPCLLLPTAIHVESFISEKLWIILAFLHAFGFEKNRPILCLIKKCWRIARAVLLRSKSIYNILCAGCPGFIRQIQYSCFVQLLIVFHSRITIIVLRQLSINVFFMFYDLNI